MRNTKQHRKMMLEVRKANKPSIKNPLLHNESSTKRLSDAEFDRLVAIHKYAKEHNLPQEEAIRKGLLDEDARRFGETEAEIRLSNRLTKEQKMDLILMKIREIDPQGTATLITKKKGEDPKAFDLFKLRGHTDRT